MASNKRKNTEPLEKCDLEECDREVSTKFERYRNKNILVVGRTGSGKTTVARYFQWALADVQIFDDWDSRPPSHLIVKKLHQDQTRIYCVTSRRKMDNDKFDYVIYTNQFISDADATTRHYTVYDVAQETHDIFTIY